MRIIFGEERRFRVSGGLGRLWKPAANNVFVITYICARVCVCVRPSRAPALRILHSRYVGWVEEADEVTQQRGSVTDHQVDCHDTDDSCNTTQQKTQHVCHAFLLTAQNVTQIHGLEALARSESDHPVLLSDALSLFPLFFPSALTERDVGPAHSGPRLDLGQSIRHEILLMQELFEPFFHTLRHGRPSFFLSGADELRNCSESNCDTLALERTTVRFRGVNRRQDVQLSFRRRASK